MKRFLSITHTLVFLFGTLLQAQPDDKGIVQKVDSLLNDANAKGIFSGQVTITHNGENIYYRQLGYADWKTKRAIDKNTIFNIGSLNKQFTEEIIHQLSNESKLAYTDKLSKYLDIYPTEIGNKITIQQLLNMEAGLGDYLENPKFEEIRFKEFTMNELLNIIKTEPLLFEPGTSKRYSNSGYVVLGAVIEKITNKSYEKIYRQELQLPWHLTCTIPKQKKPHKQIVHLAPILLLKVTKSALMIYPIARLQVAYILPLVIY
ncbi:MAG: beta-lactamase family protein [Bacteroidetes bacterium]|nr:beta-lactamase family protein [Bacteroidota bacterium]